MRPRSSPLAVRLVLVASVSSGLVGAPGCAQRRFADAGPAPSAPYPVMYRTEVGIGSCVFGPPGPPDGDVAAQSAFAAAIAAGVISAGVDAIGAALAEAGKETQDKIAAFRNVEIDAATFGPCLQIVRGWYFEFETAQQRQAADAAVKTDTAAWHGPVGAGERRALWTRRMRVAAAPDFVFEAQLVASAFDLAKGDVFLSLAPTFAWLGEPASRRGLRVSRDRDVAVFFGFSDAGEKFGAAEGVGAGIVVGRLERGVARRWAPFEMDAGATPNRGATESQWFRLKVGNAKRPVRVSALVVEHQDASAFLGFVASAFGAAKKDLKSAGTGLLPEEDE